VLSSTRELASKQVAPIAHGPVTPKLWL
jgi:hypothetical protein